MVWKGSFRDIKIKNQDYHRNFVLRKTGCQWKARLLSGQPRRAVSQSRAGRAGQRLKTENNLCTHFFNQKLSNNILFCCWKLESQLFPELPEVSGASQWQTQPCDSESRASDSPLLTPPSLLFPASQGLFSLPEDHVSPWVCWSCAVWPGDTFGSPCWSHYLLWSSENGING